MKPRHESQRTRSSDTEGTEPFDKVRALSLPKRQDSVIGSVNSVSDLYALCHKKVSTGSVIYAG